MEKFLYSNKFDKKIFKQLLNQTVYNEIGTGEDIRIVDNVPDVMDDYIDLFYRNLKL